MDKTLPAVLPQALLVYKARVDGIDFIKKQQWVVTNSVALIYAAIVWVGAIRAILHRYCFGSCRWPSLLQD
jgi:hypothetical protein